MSSITTAQIAAAYAVAASVFNDVMKPEQGKQVLNSANGLNESTAKDFIMQYRMMAIGKGFKRAMSAEALDYFITHIRSDRGAEAFENAIAASWQHIDYYEAQSGKRMLKLRAIVARHASAISAPLTLALTAVRFEAAVQQSLADTAAKRTARLSSAGKLPKRITVMSTAFVRNPDVVAEVLIRAKGTCACCKAHAPFLRKSTGEPYLEVHHTIPLAAGGEDTVENAEALCPNCHREKHFG